MAHMKMQQSTQPQEVEAFCPTCPTPEEVSAFLHGLGCHLVFQMQAMCPPASSQVAPLPAQYHYEGPAGVSVLYLVGQDADAEGVQLPPHRSRFWAYSGADPVAFLRITRAMAVRWSFSWQSPQACAEVQEVA